MPAPATPSAPAPARTAVPSSGSGAAPQERAAPPGSGRADTPAPQGERERAAWPSAPFRLGVLVASTREGRFAPVVAGWFARHAERYEHARVDVIDLAALRPYELAPGTAEFDAYAERVDRADAFVVVTPEYNHSFPAPLKHAVDLLHRQWQAKPVGFVSYGGVSGGLRAVEQLRLVFAELHAVTVRDTVSFALAGELFDTEGELRESAAADAAARRMLDQLTWWAEALRTARARHPYGT